MEEGWRRLYESLSNPIIKSNKGSAKLSKRLEWYSYFEPSSIYDDSVTRYIYELQCFVLECNDVAERHKVVIIEQNAKVCFPLTFPFEKFHIFATIIDIFIDQRSWGVFRWEDKYAGLEPVWLHQLRPPYLFLPPCTFRKTNREDVKARESRSGGVHWCIGIASLQVCVSCVQRYILSHLFYCPNTSVFCWS